MWLLAAFIAIPLVEIGLFIQVGGIIGLWPTLAIVLVTAIIGSNLVRSQGARELANLRRSFNDLNNPTEPLANGAMILFAGALLLTPGFFTDAVGFALLIPAVRSVVYRQIASRVQVVEFGTQQPRDATIIDGEFEDLTEPPSRRDGPSGWTK